MNRKSKRVALQPVRSSLAEEYKEILPQVRLDIAKLKSESLAAPIQKNVLAFSQSGTSNKTTISRISRSSSR